MFFRNNNNTNTRGRKERCRNGSNCSYGLKCNFYHFPNEIEQFKTRQNNQRSNGLGTNGYKFKPHHEKDAKHWNKKNYYQHICIGNNSHQSKSLEELRFEDQFAQIGATENHLTSRPSTNNNNNNGLWSWNNNNSNNDSKNDNKTSEWNFITPNTTNNTSTSWFNDIKTDNNIDSTNNVSNNTSNVDWGWNTNNNSTNNTNTTISNNINDSNTFSWKPNNNTNTNISNNMSDSNSNIFSWNPDNNTNTNNLANNTSSTGSVATFAWNVDSSSTNNNTNSHNKKNNNTNNNLTNNNTNTWNLTSNNNINNNISDNSNVFSWNPNNNSNTNNFTNNNTNSKNEKKNIPAWCKDVNNNNNNNNTSIVTNKNNNNNNTNNNNFVVSNNNNNPNDGMFLKYNQNPYQIDMSDGLKELNDPNSTLNHSETDWKSYISNTNNNMYSSLKHSYIQTNKSNNNKRMNLSVIKLTSRNKSYLQNNKKAPVITIKPRSSMRINPCNSNTIKNKLSIPIRRYTSEVRTIRNLGPVPIIPDLSKYFVNKNTQQLQDISENSDDSSLENDDGINENNNIMEDVVLSSTHRKDGILYPKLTRLGYYTIPSMDIIKQMNEKELYIIKDFTVGHNIHGNIIWNGISDIRSLDLDKIVFLEYGRVEVYPDHIIDKPKQAQLLNKYAMIRLNNIYPPIDENIGLTDQEYEMIKKHYGEKLAKHCEENECQFIKYDTKQGIWEFTVGHFSIYGVPYHDQNDNK